MNKLAVLLFILIFTACDKQGSSSTEHSKHEESKVREYYTCSMHPQIRESKPGKCPICHMNLTKVQVEEDDEEETTQGSTSSPSQIVMYQCANFPEVTSEVMDICPLDGSPMVKSKTVTRAGAVIAKVKLRKSQLIHFRPDLFPATTMKMSKKIRLLGSVLQSEDKESEIPARVSGRVEKVYVKSTGSFISIGDPVIDLYSPQLITAGEEYLIARKSFEKSKSQDFKEMMQQSEERLRLWGINKLQYQKWYRKGKVPNRVTIYSPATGIVKNRNAIVGKYFKEGQNFFELSDLSDIWVEMDVYEQDSALVKLGQEIKLSFSALPGQETKGEIDFINPILDPLSRTLKIRTTVSNSKGKLKPGMVAEATLSINFEGMPLVIPRSAVIDTGKRKVVWIKLSKKRYQAKTILTGYESEGYVEIKEGLMEGEEVVIEGNFLLDAQAQLFGGYEDFKNNSSTGHNH